MYQIDKFDFSNFKILHMSQITPERHHIFRFSFNFPRYTHVRMHALSCLWHSSKIVLLLCLMHNVYARFSNIASTFKTDVFWKVFLRMNHSNRKLKFISFYSCITNNLPKSVLSCVFSFQNKFYILFVRLRFVSPVVIIFSCKSVVKSTFDLNCCSTQHPKP